MNFISKWFGLGQPKKPDEYDQRTKRMRKFLGKEVNVGLGIKGIVDRCYCVSDFKVRILRNPNTTTSNISIAARIGNDSVTNTQSMYEEIIVPLIVIENLNPF